jgi:hypothetical protein
MPPLYVLDPALALGALFLALQWGMTLALNRWYAVGYSTTVTASCIFIVIGHSAQWNHIAGAILRS